MSGSSSVLDLLSSAQASKESVANVLFDAAAPAMMFGRRAQTSSGLVWGYFGGTLNVGGTPTPLANGTVTLTASATNYVEADGLGAVSVNTSGWSKDKFRLYQVVTNATGASSWTDYRTGPFNKGNDTDLLVQANTGSGYDIDCRKGNMFDLTLTANAVLTFLNPPATGRPYSMTVVLRQDATGSRTCGFNTVSGALVKWPSGTVPTLSTAASAIDVYTFFTLDGGLTWFGYQAGKGMA